MTNAPIDSSTAVERAKRKTRRGGRCTPERFVRELDRRFGTSKRLNIEAAECNTT